MNYNEYYKFLISDDELIQQTEEFKMDGAKAEQPKEPKEPETKEPKLEPKEPEPTKEPELKEQEQTKSETKTDSVDTQRFKQVHYFKSASDDYKFLESIKTDGYKKSKFVNELQNITPTETAINEDGNVIKTTKYNIVEDSTKSDVYSQYYNYKNQLHSTMIYDTSKAELSKNYYDKFKFINYYIQSPCKNVIKDCFNCFSSFVPLLAYLEEHLKTDNFKGNSDAIENSFKSKLKMIYTILKLPRELIQVINNIDYYFNEIKDQLTLNDETGFYEFKYESKAIPVICKHVYMLLSGENLYRISEECSNKNVCKYCGDNLQSNTFDDAVILPSKVAELTYKLLEIYDCSVDEQNNNYLYLYNVITSLISKYVQTNDSTFDDKAIGITALYCYYIIKTSPPKKNYTNFLSEIARLCAVLKWDIPKIESLIKSGMFSDSANVINILTGISTFTKSDIDDVFKLSPAELQKLQKENKMYDFNILYDRLNIDKIKILKIVNVIKIKLELVKISFNHSSFDTINIFNEYIKNSCIDLNGLPHKFEKNICKCCGIKSDFSNVNDIYQKYNEKFNTTYLISNESNFKMPKFEKSFNFEELKKRDVKKSINQIKTKLQINDLEFNKILRGLDKEHENIINAIKTRLYIDDDITLNNDEILNVIAAIDDDDIYEMLTMCEPYVDIIVMPKIKGIDYDEDEEN